MKTNVLWGAMLIASLSVAWTTPPRPTKNSKLVGHWQTSFPDGKTTMTAFFRPDGTYSGAVNGKVFVTGKYTLAHDTLGMEDGSCGPNYFGTYRLTYFADSLSFAVVQDSCTGRQQGTNGLRMKRVTPARK